MQLPPARRVLLVEAAFDLILARFALRVLPFRRLKPFLARCVKRPEVSGPARKRLRADVVWAIGAAARRLPGKVVCFPRAIVAQAMLRRRGVGTTLYYGVTTLTEPGPTAHVWVQDGDEGVVGFGQKSWYRVLACYPEGQTASGHTEGTDTEGTDAA